MTYKEKAQLFMERFWGRRDVYGRCWEEENEDGKMVRKFAPACSKFWSTGCHIRLKDNVPCAKCEIKEYSPVSEESVLKHIYGDEPQMQYVIQEDGTIRFGAVDFDLKPGKEHLGYTFDEIRKTIEVLKTMEIPFGIARSTGNGFHIYFFFSAFYSAVRFRAFIFEVFDRAGIMALFQQNIKPMPEIFPKQTKGGGPGSVGSAIKCPMIESNFSKGKNCFVTENNETIQDQWAHLASIPLITPQQMDALIEKENISVIETSGSKPGSTPKRGKWQTPLTGSVGKVLEGCKAFRRVRDKAMSGQVLNHQEGTALWHLAMHTADGIEWFKKNVPGWAQTEADMRQLEHSIDKNYSPWTCRKLQENGICVVGTKCFDKKPPLGKVDGQFVPLDVPEDQWPEPSPIRYAFSAGDDYLARLFHEVEELSAETNEEERKLKLTAIINRSTVFDKDQQNALKDKIAELKLEKKSALNKKFTEARVVKEREYVEAAKSRTDVITVGSLLFRKLDPHGYELIKPGKGDNELSRVVSNFDLYIEEERTIIDDKGENHLTFRGKFRSNGRESKFAIQNDTWCDNNELYKALFCIGGSDFNISKMDIDLLRQVSTSHDKDTLHRTKSVFHGTQGWHDGAYLTTSVIVDKDGVRPNTEKPVDLSGKEHASKIDFKIISDGDLKETLFHLKRDLFAAFPKGSVFVGLGHCMMAGLITHLNINFRPVLWYEGDSGAGKTQLCILLQKFWGDFSGPAAWRTSGVSMTGYGYAFKDALLLADDYKETNPGQRISVINTVHNAYEITFVGKMTRDGKQRGDQSCRCLFIMSGEVTPESEASFIGRLILIEYPKGNQFETKAAFDKCSEYSDNYRGITPKFIHWVLQQDKAAILRDMSTVRDALHKDIIGTGNDSRIANNIGFAFCGWKLFAHFMYEHEALTKQEVTDLIQEAWVFCKQVRDGMVNRCTQEQTGMVFLNKLTELLSTGRAYIKGLDTGVGEPDPRAICVGFVSNDPADAGTAYLYPGTVIEQVKKSVSHNLVGTSQSIGNQFRSMKLLASTDQGRSMIQKRHDGGVRNWMWHVYLDKIGIASKKQPQLVHSAEAPKPQPEINKDGII